MRKKIDDLKLVVERTVIEMPPDTTKLMPFREFVPGVTSAFLDGVCLSESETKAVIKVLYPSSP